MKLVDLIEHLKKIETAINLASSELPEAEYGSIEVFANVLDVNSEVRFFDSDRLSEDGDIQIDGIVYINVLPLSLFQDMVQAFSESTDATYSNLQIAKRILDYSINDA